MLTSLQQMLAACDCPGKTMGSPCGAALSVSEPRFPYLTQVVAAAMGVDSGRCGTGAQLASTRRHSPSFCVLRRDLELNSWWKRADIGFR